ncbi:sodium/glutamate symporter (plasmid) [Roseobacter denitrificans]|uniref:Sodium/glutamate symporter n=1 Tax=Roseobacter denitrificans (strain ATCC 33942 / OCh 114) TaxID=375451 RepID=Q07GU3_ROSDO|nr:sodium/glutamate symporter [Roseobacter denitrificans]ABI93306.1 sodium/glutamate symporter [Roseobacter denitrificans OCh 114]AVL51228.1 sodium/glutamate symporter [Roseobacter denitrificans]SFG40441.1 glutamate:Na+ symporter, ESS family [Roseobacter denitrificans OCh 114]
MTSPIVVPAFIAATLGFIVFFLGAFLTRKVAFLKNYNIPEPVSGGIAVAVLTWGWFVMTGREITFEMDVRDYLLVLFFATIGLNARIADLFKGGRLLVILLLLTVGFMLLQNIVGLIGVQLFGLPNPVSVLLGSASLIGGHGTAIAWGPQIETLTGFEAAAEVGIATATLGLVLAALIGGPIAKWLIDRNHLSGESDATPIVGLSFDKETGESVNHVSLMRATLAAHVAILLGWFAHQAISEMGLLLPLFVPCLLMGIVMSNTVPYLFKSLTWPAGSKALAVVSDYALSVFLAMSLMSMQLWTLAELGGPLIIVLLMQVVMTVGFILFVVFRAIGRGYLAAVLSAGFAGFALGATPTAIANMSSVTKRYGAAPLAFIVLPLVSAFFVDLANALAIRFFIGL